MGCTHRRLQCEMPERSEGNRSALSAYEIPYTSTAVDTKRKMMIIEASVEPATKASRSKTLLPLLKWAVKIGNF